jgi:hypothetical protein
MIKRNQEGFAHLIVFLLVLVVLAVSGFALWRLYKTHGPLPTADVSGNTISYDQSASRQLTNGSCQGAGSVRIGPPMKLDQVSFVLPYGEVVGGHVTPIDHQYYNGLDVHALRDTYDVIAPADGQIVNIQHRGNKVHTPAHTVDQPSSDEYRIVMAHTCSFLTYVDLVTSLDQNVLSHLPSGWNPSQGFSGSIPITKGEVIGHIGGQTLDFAVWDLSKKLSGFVNPASYSDAEPWKIFTAPPSQYFDSSVKAQVVAKYVRTVQPVDGRIDYDVDGRLIGNWFLQGSGGYHAQSNQAQNYWTGHLSIAPDSIDPSVYVASIGNYDSYGGSVNANSYNGGAEQYMIKSASPDPTTVGQSNGPVKYELLQKQYVLPSGQRWDNMTFATGLKAAPINSQVTGTIVAQVTGAQTLKFEAFPGKSADQVLGFDASAKIYNR